MDDPRAQSIRDIDFIVIDEAFCLLSRILDLFERFCRLVRGNELPFGGLVVLLCGDPRQTLPVLKNANTAMQMESVLPNCAFWKFVQQLTLTVNLRVQASPESVAFTQMLLNVGNGNCPNILPGDREETAPVDSIQIDPRYLLDHRTLDPVQDMIDFTYDGLLGHYMDSAYFTRRAILTPLNDDVHDINARVLSMLPGQEIEHRAIDILDEKENANLWTPEVLQTVNVPGLPQSLICIKPYAIVMLLRNLSIKDGLVNGTRLRVLPHPNSKFVLYCEVLTGAAEHQRVFIPRIFLEPTTANLPFVFKRRQFPIRVCFAMTVNKSQGQGFDRVSVYLPRPVFSHGQLYVALSRLTDDSGLRVLIIPTKGQGQMCKHSTHTNWTRNVVLKEILQYLLYRKTPERNYTMSQAHVLTLTQINMDNMLTGKKTVEVRLKNMVSHYKSGDSIVFTCGSQEAVMIVQTRHFYRARSTGEVERAFSMLMVQEGLQNVLPGCPTFDAAYDYILDIYNIQGIVKQGGFVALRLLLQKPNIKIALTGSTPPPLGTAHPPLPPALAARPCRPPDLRRLLQLLPLPLLRPHLHRFPLLLLRSHLLTSHLRSVWEHLPVDSGSGK